MALRSTFVWIAVMAVWDPFVLPFMEDQLALRARRFGLMCSEEAYQALRLDPGAEWQPTDLRVALANRPPQVVYRWGAGAS